MHQLMQKLGNPHFEKNVIWEWNLTNPTLCMLSGFRVVDDWFSGLLASIPHCLIGLK
jgi:hypothetical protein